MVLSERHKQDSRYAIRAAERAQHLAERVESLPGDYRVDKGGGVRPLTGRAWFASLLRAGELEVPESVLVELAHRGRGDLLVGSQVVFRARQEDECHGRCNHHPREEVCAARSVEALRRLMNTLKSRAA